MTSARRPIRPASHVRRGAPAPEAGRRRARAAREPHAIENAEIARIFERVADLLEIGGANPFRVRAYRNAARTAAGHPESLAMLVREEPRKLTELPGIGPDLAGKIEEIVRSGRLAMLDELERAAPPGAAALMRVPGVGPKRARVLCEQLGVRTLDALRTAAREGRIHALRGFGVKTEQRILRELQTLPGTERRVLRAIAAQYGEALLAYIRAVPGVDRAELAGSFRRCAETVGDLDLLVSCRRGSRVADRFVAYPEAEEVLAHGPTRCSIRLRSGLQVDLRVLPGTSWGAGLHYFTGSKAHNIAIRRLGQERGLKINEYGIFRGRRRIAGAEEEDVFTAVGLPWIPPELREDRGELAAAAQHALPKLVTLAELRGDLQCHTTDSDGRNSLEEMARAAEAMGYEYLAITDHTPSVRVAGGLDRAGFRRQRKRIDRLNACLAKLTVLAGAEVDIRADGTLDLDGDTLAALDVVVVALHSRLGLAQAEQTRRVLRALRHPMVDIFSHPTGRLIGSRRGAAFDLDAILTAAADTGVMLEVNAQPERLDLDDVAARAAIERGISLVIDTDAHAVTELRLMRWGVDQARRAWAEARHVANTLPLEYLLRRLHGRR